MRISSPWLFQIYETHFQQISAAVGTWIKSHDILCPALLWQWFDGQQWEKQWRTPLWQKRQLTENLQQAIQWAVTASNLLREEKKGKLHIIVLLPWSWVQLQKATVVQPVKGFPTCYGTLRLSTMFKKPTTGTYPQLDECSPYPHTIFL